MNNNERFQILFGSSRRGPYFQMKTLVLHEKIFEQDDVLHSTLGWMGSRKQQLALITYYQVHQLEMYLSGIIWICSYFLFFHYACSCFLFFHHALQSWVFWLSSFALPHLTTYVFNISYHLLKPHQMLHFHNFAVLSCQQYFHQSNLSHLILHQPRWESPTYPIRHELNNKSHNNHPSSTFIFITPREPYQSWCSIFPPLHSPSLPEPLCLQHFDIAFVFTTIKTVILIFAQWYHHP